MRYILTAIDDAMFDAWTKHCGRIPDVTIVRASIADVRCQALVAPTNSWCVMDGGADVAIAQACGGEPFLARVREETRPPLPVGCAQAVPSCDNIREIEHAILAPTMVVPEKLPHDTVNPYLATIAAMKEVTRLNLTSVAFVGMGTGVGKLPHELAAWQWALAYWRSRLHTPPRCHNAADTLLWRQSLITIGRKTDKQLTDLIVQQVRHDV